MNKYRIMVMFGIIAVLLILFQPVTVLSVDAVNTHMKYGMYTVEVNDLLEYSYIHSVSNSPVIETIWINEAMELVTTKVKYQDQSGAGLPEYVGDHEKFRQEDDWFIIEGLSVVSQSLSIHVHELYDNTLKLDEREIKLYEYFSDGSGLVNIHVDNYAYIIYMIQRALFVE